MFFDVPGTSPTFADRVFSKIEITQSCWLWTRATDDKGYGIVGRGGRGSGNMFAHRAVWELLLGPIPNDLVFDHLCRNHSCVNPEHGELVTLEENKRRGFGRAILLAKRDLCGHGHPLDGTTTRRSGPKAGETVRYCKICARIKSLARYYAKGSK